VFGELMLPALIGAGASLLGGILGNNAQKKVNNQNIAFQRENNAVQQKLVREQNAYNDPKALRKRAEKAGFNPLLFVGPGVGQQMGVASTSAPQIAASNYMGAAVADAGMMIADQMSKNRELARLEKLSAENKKLAEKVQNLTIRPKVGGVYDQREAYNAINRPVTSDGVSVQGARLSDGDAVTPKAKNTYETFINDGKATDIPVGPDLDEVVSGAFIAANNMRKYYRDNHTFGPTSMPVIEMPPGYQPKYPTSKRERLDRFLKSGWPTSAPVFGFGF
jgi:cell division protein FtsB